MAPLGYVELVKTETRPFQSVQLPDLKYSVFSLICSEVAIIIAAVSNLKMLCQNTGHYQNRSTFLIHYQN